MDLYETDKNTLVSFIENKGESDLILYDFATDLKHSKTFQNDLILSLLPCYIKALEKSILSESPVHMQIIGQFNVALFLNKDSFINSVSASGYDMLMSEYEKNIFKKINQEGLGNSNWIEWYNTFLAFDVKNIVSFFENFDSNINKHGRNSFFFYISCLLFEKKDNLIINQVEILYQSPILWDFRSEQLACFFWSKEISEVFDSYLNIGFVRSLFVKTKSLLLQSFDYEDILFLEHELNSSAILEVFKKRKEEYLNNMKSGKENQYWLDAF